MKCEHDNGFSIAWKAYWHMGAGIRATLVPYSPGALLKPERGNTIKTRVEE